MSPLLLWKDAIRTREAVEKLTFSGKTGLCKGQRLKSDRSGRDHSEQAESAHLLTVTTEFYFKPQSAK